MHQAFLLSCLLFLKKKIYIYALYERKQNVFRYFGNAVENSVILDKQWLLMRSGSRNGTIKQKGKASNGKEHPRPRKTRNVMKYVYC